MSSPVDTSVKYFTSDMPGAPVLTGQAGSLIGLLDACLVNGWGVQTATSVVVSGGVATATFPANHAGFVDAVVLVAGATPATLNGEQKVTVRGPNTIKWATAAADGTATGTITVKMAAAGFNKPFSATNIAVYKSAKPDANGQCLRISDTTTRNLSAVGYETMSAASTGTGPFPTSVQKSGGYMWCKSENANADPVPWAVISDGRCFYFCSASLVPGFGAAYMSMGPFFFGDTIPRSNAGDAFATLLSGSSNGEPYNMSAIFLIGAEYGTHVAAPRAFTAIGTAVRGQTSLREITRSEEAVPNPITGKVSFSQVVLRDSAESQIRSEMPGLGVSTLGYIERLFPTQFSFFKTSDGRSALGLPAQIAGAASAATNFSMLAFDITGPWR